MSDNQPIDDGKQATGANPDPAAKGGQSGTFTPPATQDDFDRMIADRISRERAKFADYDDLKTKASEYDKVVEASKTEQQKQAEELELLRQENSSFKAREQAAAWAKEVSDETGVPASALRGSTKEELAAHAAELKALITQPETRPQPIPGEGRPGALPLNGDGIETALKNALSIQ